MKKKIPMLQTPGGNRNWSRGMWRPVGAVEVAGAFCSPAASEQDPNVRAVLWLLKNSHTPSLQELAFPAAPPSLWGCCLLTSCRRTVCPCLPTALGSPAHSHLWAPVPFPLGSPPFCLFTMEKMSFYSLVMFWWPKSCLVIEGKKELAGRGEASRKLSWARSL